ncbi:MAG: glycosyltransferase, partial [Bacteroidota bacterium]
FAGSSNRSLVSKAARWIRGNVFIPDARAGWVRHAVNRAAQLHRAQPFDAVLTTGPPHSTHVAGLRIQKRLNLPWIADFRDPWTEVYYYDDFPRSAVARYIDANLEARVLRMADRIVSVGPRLADRLEELAGLTEPPAVIYNGYDEADFQGAGFQEEDFRGLGVRSTDHPVFTIGHVGTFSHSMNPPALWEALARLCAQGERVALKFTGTLDQSVLDSLSAYGLRDNVDLIPPVSHAEALRAMCTADVLLLSIPTSAPDQESILTGKLFEYLRAGRPILAFGPAEGDASAVLKHTERGSTFAHEGSSDAVLEWIHHQKAAFPSAALPVIPAVRAFERRSQAGQLAALLTEAVSHSSESTPA